MNNIDNLIYEGMFKRISNLMLEEIQVRLSSSNLTEKERLKYLTLLQEGYFEKIYNILQYIKKNLLYIIFGTTDNPEVSNKIDEIKQNYNIISNDFVQLQNNPDSTEEDKNNLRKRIEQLKQSVIDVKNMKEGIPEADNDIVVSNSEFPISTSNDMNISQYTDYKGTESVGKTTESTDIAATYIWRKYWKTRCGNISGKKLNQCKARGVDLAIGLIKSKLRLCNNTVDPDGCKQTLNNMINKWNEKKKEYLKY